MATVIASEPGWLRAAGQAAGTILLVELGLVLIIVAALTAGIAFAMWWLRKHVSPVLSQYAPKAEQAMSVAQKSSERVVNGVAEFYGRRQQVRTTIRVLLFGRQAAQRVHDTELNQVASDLQLMSIPEETPGPENGFTPQLRGGPITTGMESAAPLARPSLATPAAEERTVYTGRDATDGHTHDLDREHDHDHDRDSDLGSMGHLAGAAG